MRGKTIIRPIILLTYLVLPIAVQGAEHSISSRTLPPLLERSGSSHFEPLFELLPPRQTGIDFVHPIDTSHPRKYLYVGGYASPGIAIGDLNSDGLQDLFVTGGPVKNRLYLQTGAPESIGSFHFPDATKAARVDGGDAWCAGATMVDIDNDGDLDVYVCCYDSPNLLLSMRRSRPMPFVSSNQPENSASIWLMLA